MALATRSPTHELVWVAGPDAVTFLDGLLSQDVAGIEPGRVARSLLLAPNGKLRALLFVLRGDGEVGLVADMGWAEAVATDLERFKLRVDVGISEPLPLFTVVGDDLDVAMGAWRRVGRRVEVAAPLGEIGRVLTTSAAPEAAELGAAALDAMRIEAGEPRMGVDVDTSTIPQETGLVPDAIDFDKGCYLGQELVARIDSRGHVNRRLARVTLDDRTASPVSGARVVVAGADLGVLTSVAPGRGMGLIRREVAPGDRVEVAWNDETAAGTLDPSAEFASR